MDEEKAALLHFLRAQRAVVVAVIEGLDAEAMGSAVLPSGWSALGMIEHLGHAERHWFQEIVLGEADPLPWADENTPLRRPATSRPSSASTRTCAGGPTT